MDNEMRTRMHYLLLPEMLRIFQAFIAVKKAAGRQQRHSHS
jgi:hypothetical protein